MVAAISDPGQTWDVIVIGGGATGLGAALEAASRGHRTALVERDDFAKGTSSRSTKLIHGGVRYLAQGRVGMVRQSLLERTRLLRNAPHIVHPLSFVLPSFGRISQLYYYSGLRAYDLLAGSHAFGKSQLLSRAETIRRLPTLKADGLSGGVLFSDGQFDDARLAISLARTVADFGSVVVNYAPVTELIHEAGRVVGVVLKDEDSQQSIRLKGRQVINATGVFADEILKLDRPAGAGVAANDSQQAKVAPSQGSHLVLDRSFLPTDHAMMIPKTDDGRVLFAIPWHGKVLFGTTDLAVNRIARDPRPLPEELNYLLDHAGRSLARQPVPSDIQSMYAGLRPLVRSAGTKSGPATSQLSREHEILVSESKLISVIGGKWTTYRHMGQEVVDLAERVGGLKHAASVTADLQLHGWPGVQDQTYSGGNADPLAVYGCERTEIQKLADSDSALQQQLHPDLSAVAAEVVFAARFEMARTVEDVLSRRTRSLLLNARAATEAAPATAALLAAELGRSEQWQRDQVREFTALAENYLPSALFPQSL